MENDRHLSIIRAQRDQLAASTLEIQKAEEAALHEMERAKRIHDDHRQARLAAEEMLKKLDAILNGAASTQHQEPRMPPSRGVSIMKAARTRSGPTRAVMAEKIVEEASGVIGTEEIFAALKARGIEFKGSEPIRNLQSILSRSTVVRHIRTPVLRGWGMVGRVYPEEEQRQQTADFSAGAPTH